MATKIFYYNMIGNGEAKELKCTTHGHELRVGGNVGGRKGKVLKELKGRKSGTTVIA